MENLSRQVKTNHQDLLTNTFSPGSELHANTTNWILLEMKDQSANEIHSRNNYGLGPPVCICSQKQKDSVHYVTTLEKKMPGHLTVNVEATS